MVFPIRKQLTGNYRRFEGSIRRPFRVALFLFNDLQLEIFLLVKFKQQDRLVYGDYGKGIT